MATQKARKPGRRSPAHSKTSASGNQQGATNGTEPSPTRQGDESPLLEVERYTYHDEHGRKLFQVRRYEPKAFRQFRWNGNRWMAGLKGVGPVPYRLPDVIAAVKAGQPIDIPEGERDVHTLEALGRVATCNPGGAGKWRPEFNEFLRGAQIRIHVDNDPAGYRHGLHVARSLDGVAASVDVLRPVKGCKDVTDHVNAGHLLTSLRETTEPNLAVLVAGHAATQRPKDATVAGERAAGVPLVLHTLVGLLASCGPVVPPREPGGDWQVCCPVHEDRKPSATLRAGTDRPVVFKCHADCESDDFLKWCQGQGVPLGDLMDTKGPFTDELSDEMQAIVEEVGRVMGALNDGDFNQQYDELIDDAGLDNEPDPEWVVPGWLERKGYTPIYAPAGTGKTAIAIAVAETVGQGRHDWLNVKPERGAVMFLSGEGRSQLKVRRRTFLEEMGWSPGGAMKLYGTARDLESPVGVASVVHNVRRLEQESGEKVQLIVVDPLNEFMSADENGEGMHNVSRGLRALAIITDTAVLVGHHTNAAGEVERGNKVLRNRALAMIQMQKINDDTVALIQTKQKNAGELAAVFMRCGSQRGITFRLMEMMPSHEFHEAIRERVEESKRVRRSQKESADYEAMRKLLVGWFEENPEGGSASGITRRGGLLGNGYGDDKLRQVLTQMVSNGEVEQAGEGRGAIYRMGLNE